MALNWHDIIEIKKDKPELDTLPPKVRQVYTEKIEQFLDRFQHTDMGQEMLRSIREKYSDPKVTAQAGTSKLRIFLNNNFMTLTYPDGRIDIDVRDPDYLAFIDQRTGKPIKAQFENILLHELCHAANKKIKIGENNQDENFITVVEEGAVLMMDKYAKKYQPEWGVRGAYANFAGDKPLDDTGRRGILILNEDAGLRATIADAVQTVDVRIKNAERALEKGPAPRQPGKPGRHDQEMNAPSPSKTKGPASHDFAQVMEGLASSSKGNDLQAEVVTTSPGPQLKTRV